MIETHFTSSDITFLLAGILSALLAVWFFYKGKYRASIVLLVVAGFSFRLMMAFIDPFVNIWDEQYHALVAKNMAEHFFHPTLVEKPVLPLDPSYWAFTHHWVHKPPLFLWQMAAAIKLFGASPWAIRLPSVILSTLMIPAIYRMGKRISGERTGFLAALLLACSNIHINVVSGFLNTDQNDVVFAAYVLFSFWSWTEYLYKPSRRYVVLTGIFVAGAVLTKWLPGMLVFGAWGMAMISIRDFRISPKRWKDLALSVIIAIGVACPWFLYAASTWPEEWKITMNHYSDHLHDSMAHPGEWWYHFKEVIQQFGWWFAIVLVPALVIFWRSKISPAFKAGITASIVAVFGFYSVVSTKMPLFCFVVTPLLILVVAYFICYVLEAIYKSKYSRMYAPVLAITSLVLVLTMLNFGRLEHFHTDRDPKEFYRKTRIHNRACFEQIENTLPENAVIFNCGTWNAVPCMFYTSYTAYDGVPDEVMIAEAKRQKRTLAVFDDGQLPDYIVQDSSIVILKQTLIRNGF